MASKIRRVGAIGLGKIEPAIRVMYSRADVTASDVMAGALDAALGFRADRLAALASEGDLIAKRG